ncbi:MAG: hypothetical protein VYB43_06850 [Pseudomonadota bacterium]|nr:hypothetical protein [Pseudomonadota bacterium]
MKSCPFGLCRLGLRAIGALLLLGTISVGKADPSINVWLSAEFENGWPVESNSNRFGCNDKIYAVIDLLELEGGAHRLQADWTDPGGKIREHVDYPFNGAGSTRITIWLKLHPPKGSALFSFFNPAMGMDDFIGLWQLAIRVDDDTRFNTEFEVLC